ncbi:unnamed protein product [Parascedosporium putredinis]|uniref:Mpv17-like protein n=1 Tax=Parascedosporium putredinis TaxID=1442378 RepID=A0A9P1H8P7_9PEZI|nr:unnamed protein product [Parascedosporium putredinis]CAI8002604.1 unnamed protein product [Parascedosporium putredinis]
MLLWYQSILARRPVLTQSVTTAVLNTVGDITAQQAVEKRGKIMTGSVLHEWLSTEEGRSPKENVKKNFLPIMATNYMVWPWVQLANFKFVPLNHRLTFANTVAIGWNCYISYMNNRDR